MEQLDLHGLNYKEAVLMAEDFVLMQSNDIMGLPCKIITGNSTPMKNIIFDMLIKHDFKYYVPSHNMGEIVVVG